jgi:hypothetical protein
MRNIMKIRQVIMAGIFASMLAVVIPASPVLAAETIELDPEEGEIGDEVEISGDDFDESNIGAEDYVYVRVYFAADEADKGDEIDDEVDTYRRVVSSLLVDTVGDFDGSFDVPSELISGTDDESVTTGTYYVYVTYSGDDEIIATAEFQIIGGDIEIYPDEGSIGTEVTINGTGFIDDEQLTVEFDDSEVDIVSGDESADNDGEFELTILVPQSTAGDHTITVIGDEGSEAEADFAIGPEMTVSPASAPPGDTVLIFGTGFGDRVEVDIILGSFGFVTETNRGGSFSYQFKLPELDEGVYKIDAEDEDGNDAVVDFTVEEEIAFAASPTTSALSPGYVGQRVTVSGTAFKPNTQVTVTYTSTPQTLLTTISDANGNFTSSFLIPESAAGSHTITASDGTNSIEVPFYMESQAPQIPLPLLPSLGGKADALAVFDWENVNDASGVTYTLQVATRDDFALSSMVLVEERLASSEYTLTDEEKLPSRSAGEPYYWRVKAVDGASNESGWSAPGEFSVGLSLPSWMIHVWWGLGCFGAGMGGYWVCKRRK